MAPMSPGTGRTTIPGPYPDTLNLKLDADKVVCAQTGPLECERHCCGSERGLAATWCAEGRQPLRRPSARLEALGPRCLEPCATRIRARGHRYTRSEARRSLRCEKFPLPHGDGALLLLVLLRRRHELSSPRLVTRRARRSGPTRQFLALLPYQASKQEAAAQLQAEDWRKGRLPRGRANPAPGALFAPRGARGYGGGERLRPGAPGRGHWQQSGGAFTEGPKRPRRSAGASRLGWALLFPGEADTRPTTAGSLSGRAARIPNPKSRTSSQNCREFRAQRAHAGGWPWVLRGPAGQARAERAELPGGRAGIPGGAGRAPLPPAGWRPAEKRAARTGVADSAPRGARRFAAAGPRPGLREPHSPGRAAVPTCTPLGPAGLAADGAGAGARRAHGWPRGAAAGGGAGSGSTRPAARTRRRRAGRAQPGARPETERKRKTGKAALASLLLGLGLSLGQARRTRPKR
ncbi:PREDICTED: uncharacterized protein LOC109391140 [Hipposideros armiger]|uniref:Uncharacterized protein LOC109391140 n=1 Tax=Hipposideros armiger TaxID=186990 RepID=A0A8B7SPL4_HIPAR|nr:PREDICTED: uncharacterized protein LOC109391140 [Hipposideros armiger]